MMINGNSPSLGEVIELFHPSFGRTKRDLGLHFNLLPVTCQAQIRRFHEQLDWGFGSFG